MIELPPTNPINDLINIAQQLGDMDTSTLSRGIQTPGVNKRASQRSTQNVSDGRAKAVQKTSAQSPTRIRTQALLSKLITAVESQIVSTLACAYKPVEKLEARLMVGFLSSQRKLLIKYSQQTPEDVCLLESLIEFTTFVEGALAQLQSPKANRFIPIAHYLREKYSGLVLYGICQPVIKKDLKAIKTQLQNSEGLHDIPSITKQLYSCYEKMEKLILASTKSLPASFLDEITFND